MKKLLFWGNIQVFAGISKIKETEESHETWIIHDQETLTCMLRTALLNATRGDLKTAIPFTLKQIDFSDYSVQDYTYYVKCLVEVDENVYQQIDNQYYQDFRDFYVTEIPTFEYQIEDNIEPQRMCGEFCLKL